MRFRQATVVDLPRITDLLELIGMQTGDLNSHLVHFVVAEQGDELVGMVGLEPHGEAGLLRSLAVAPGFRGQGVALELCQRVETMATALGIQKLYLLTETAAGYFARRGFSTVDRIAVPAAIRAARQFAEFCPESATLMCREISDTRT